MKQDTTLEEAAINFYREFPSNPLDKPEWHYNRDVDCFKKRKAFINGAKYMAERMYSEEEVIELLQKALTHKDDGETGSLVTAQGQIRTANFFSWFNKFKTK